MGGEKRNERSIVAQRVVGAGNFSPLTKGVS